MSEYDEGRGRAGASAAGGTRSAAPVSGGADPGLRSDVERAFSLAPRMFPDLDRDRLRRAHREAMLLAGSGLFGPGFLPHVFVDAHGECTFSHKSRAGYVDIGVRGDGELSYHVRNDVDPARTRYEDRSLEDGRIPRVLFEAVEALRAHLQES